MNELYLFTGFTFITVIAAYFSGLRLLEFDFIQKNWYKVTESILWFVTVGAWVADIVFLKSYFTSDVTLGAQFVIQVVLNAVLIFWPPAILGFFIKGLRP